MRVLDIWMAGNEIWTMNCGDFKSNSCVFYLDWTQNYLDLGEGYRPATLELWILCKDIFGEWGLLLRTGCSNKTVKQHKVPFETKEPAKNGGMKTRRREREKSCKCQWEWVQLKKIKRERERGWGWYAARPVCVVDPSSLSLSPRVSSPPFHVKNCVHLVFLVYPVKLHSV